MLQGALLASTTPRVPVYCTLGHALFVLRHSPEAREQLMLSLQAMAKQPGMYDSEVHAIHGVHRYGASD